MATCALRRNPRFKIAVRRPNNQTCYIGFFRTRRNRISHRCSWPFIFKKRMSGQARTGRSNSVIRALANTSWLDELSVLCETWLAVLTAEHGIRKSVYDGGRSFLAQRNVTMIY